VPLSASAVASDATHAAPPVSAFTVDVEDYFQVEAFSRDVARERWPDFASRVEANTHRLLETCARHGVHGTFYVLGWVATRYPALVRDIHAGGHEVGCHSYWHRLIYTLAPREFADDTLRAKAAIEDAAGTAVTAYRAPTFSITRESLWAFDVLADCGFSSDSSVFPIHHDHYGLTGSPQDPYAIDLGGRRMTEFPISTFRAFGRALPIAGGGYLRMLPMWYNRLGIAAMQRAGRPTMVYVHPWEVDPDQPRISARLKSRLRHYTNLAGMAARVDALLARYPFAPVADVLKDRDLPTYTLDRDAARLVRSDAPTGS
jgi:polysaccharide deacetylase family protein (PEP-CTERM system associated)